MIRGVLGSRASIGGPLGSGRGGAGNGLLTGLVGYWALDEAGGANNALDKHSGGLTLTQANNPGANTGKVYSTARTFNGSSQLFSRSSETALQVGDIDFVVAAWVYPTATPSTAGGILCKDAISTGTREYLMAINSSRYGRFNVSGDGTNVTGVGATALTLNAWSLLVGWHDATANKIYIQINNGTVEEAAHSTGVYVGTTALTVGDFTASPNLYFTGRLGPICMWKNRTLSAADRTALWNGGAGLAYSAYS